MSNASARAKLLQLSAKLRGIAPEMGERLAKAGAEELEKVLTDNIANARGPDGKRWQMNQDGSQPLKKAARALTVTARGLVVIARLDGPEALHHLGKARGHIVRKILPTKYIPQPVLVALHRVIRRDFRSLLGLE